jgi:ATP-binding cassette subfamily B protein
VKRWSRLLSYFSGERKGIAAAILLMLLGIAANVLKPWPVAVMVDSVIGQKPIPSVIGRVFAGADKLAQLAFLAALILIFHFLQGLFSSGQNYLSIKAGLRGLTRLRRELFEHMQRLSLAFYHRSNQGDLIYRATWDTYSLQTIFQHGIFKFLNAACSLSLMVVVMSRLNLRLTAITVAIFPPMFVTMYFFGRAMNRRSLAAHQADSKVTSLVQENLAALPLVQSYTQEAREQRRFNEQVEAAFSLRMTQHGLEVLYWLIIALLFGIATAGLSWFGAREILAARLTVGELLIFLAYLTQLYEPLNQLTHVGATVSDAGAGVQRIFEILDTVPEVEQRKQIEETARPGAIKKEPPQIRFENVTFGYVESAPVLREISFQIDPGETVAIVGPSGAGKTTLLNLLPRFFDPQTGRITINGANTRDLPLLELRRQIAYVFQEPLLIPATIAENIGYGRESASKDEIMTAARAANAEEFILRLPEGYNTIVGEGAARLSVGEKQRLNIARAFLKNAPVLLLDEPTSALDAETEAAVVESLQRLFTNRTTLMVAHRLSTIEGVDKILVLEQGRISDFGTPEAILKKAGYFSRVAQKSFGKI